MTYNSFSLRHDRHAYRENHRNDSGKSLGNSGNGKRHRNHERVNYSIGIYSRFNELHAENYYAYSEHKPRENLRELIQLLL